MKLTEETVERIVADKKSHFSTWNKKSIQSFQSIWEERLRMAIEFHKDSKLESLARGVLTFVGSRNPKNIRLYVGRSIDESYGFLYDIESKDYFQMIEADQSQQDTVPNPSGPVR